MGTHPPFATYIAMVKIILYPGYNNIVTITGNEGDCYLADSTSCEHLCSDTTNSTNANDHNSVITNTLYI